MKSANRDSALAWIAARQHGVVTRKQLRTAGFSDAAVVRAIQAGRLHRVHRGVYAVGHSSLGNEGRWMAAVLACGPGAVLSHGAAAALWGFLRPTEGPVDVSVPSLAGRKPRAGISVHRTSLPRRDLARRAEIPVTTPRRTTRDLRRTAPDLMRRAAREAQHSGYRVTTDRTRSDLELEFLAFCRRHRLPRPEVNVRLGDSEAGRLTVDFLWRPYRLVVETDSYEYHGGDVSFEDDHTRDLALRQLGFEVLRYTGRQLGREGDPIAAEIRSRF